jgi:hypothetical protein
MSIETYQTKQNRIYQQFQTAMDTLPTVQASPLAAKPASGYIVAWLHADALMERLAQLNAQINQIVPVMRFDSSNAHTTITVYQLQPADAFQVDEQILQSLTEACFDIDHCLLQSVCIQFDQWLFKEDAVIAAGQPNDAFWQVGEALQCAGKKHGLELRMPWGAHITAARYLTISNKVTELNALMRQTPGLGESWPQAIVVGHFTCGQAGLRLYPRAIRRI